MVCAVLIFSGIVGWGVYLRRRRTPYQPLPPSRGAAEGDESGPPPSPWSASVKGCKGWKLPSWRRDAGRSADATGAARIGTPEVPDGSSPAVNDNTADNTAEKKQPGRSWTFSPVAEDAKAAKRVLTGRDDGDGKYEGKSITPCKGGEDKNEVKDITPCKGGEGPPPLGPTANMQAGEGKNAGKNDTLSKDGKGKGSKGQGQQGRRLAGGLMRSKGGKADGGEGKKQDKHTTPSKGGEAKKEDKRVTPGKDAEGKDDDTTPPRQTVVQCMGISPAKLNLPRPQPKPAEGVITSYSADETSAGGESGSIPCVGINVRDILGADGADPNVTVQ